MERRIAYFSMLLLLIADVAYSFLQHFHIPLDGDMAAIILPAPWYQQVLQDPFGFSAILHGEKYGGANRFLCHWFLSVYYKNAPLILQKIVSPITSIYLAGALIKTVIQVLIIWVLSAYISGKNKIADKEMLLAAFLITPLFQTQGYNGLMGIIEKSPTYTFFYPLPIGLLLLFFLPYFLKSCYQVKSVWTGWFSYLPMLLLIVVLPFSGPLIPPLVLLLCGFVFTVWGAQHMFQTPGLSYPFQGSLPKLAKAGLALLALLSLYSFYLGTFNIENAGNVAPMWDRYASLPIGLYKQMTQKLAFPLLCGAIFFNYWWMRRLKINGYHSMLATMRWALLFAFAYLLLLPLGGFREYRPLIVRHDSMMPVTIILIYLFGASTFFLIKQLSANLKAKYFVGVALFLLIFTVADKANLHQNKCEQEALAKLSISVKSPVLLEQDCTVMSWQKITDPAQSWVNANLLRLWNVTPDVRLYYQE